MFKTKDMKTAEHYLMRWRDCEFELDELIELAQKEAYHEGQSSPKIKQLEWDFYGAYYSAETPVGHYVILEGDEQYLENYITCSLTYNGSLIAEFNSIKEAQSAAQTDFERRVMNCIEL